MLLNLLVQQPPMLGRIIENTPNWVWALLAGLLWLGGCQLLARNVSLGRASRWQPPSQSSPACKAQSQ